MSKYLIRTFSREDLESRLENNVFIMFAEEDIRAELNRRDEFIRAAQDTVKYPELSHVFH